MNAIDLITLLIIAIGIAMGAARGILGAVSDVIAIVGSLILASFVYRGPVTLFNKFGIVGTAMELTCFLVVTFALFFGILLLLNVLLRKRASDDRLFIDRLLGMLVGFVEGCVLASGMLIILSVSANSGKDIAQGRISPAMVRVIPETYARLEGLGISLPKMIVLPADYSAELQPGQVSVRFMKLNFARMGGGKCLKCHGAVVFNGYLLKDGAALLPKFTCAECGRTSDGCQTFEGFHALYEHCPVELARQKKQRFDCGNWTNYQWVSPKGSCPVDGEEMTFLEWQPPARDR